VYIEYELCFCVFDSIKQGCGSGLDLDSMILEIRVLIWKPNPESRGKKMNIKNAPYTGSTFLAFYNLKVQGYKLVAFLTLHFDFKHLEQKFVRNPDPQLQKLVDLILRSPPDEFIIINI
jgi:hypothetical protein